MAGPIGVFGGTFDPIHYGHLRPALELMQSLELAEMRIMPCGEPPHRDRPVADAQTRLALVRAAIDDHPHMLADDREVRRDGPSYTVDTLSSLRAEFPDRSICLTLGMDAFIGITRWDRWREILQLAHIVVAHRPGWQAPMVGVLAELLRECGTGRSRDLHDYRAGRIYIQAVTQLEISSTAIREMMRDGRNPKFLTPDAVIDRMRETDCYAEEPPRERGD
jgi:nicotinate-nucleotide adenylyltransferase